MTFPTASLCVSVWLNMIAILYTNCSRHTPDGVGSMQHRKRPANTSRELEGYNSKLCEQCKVLIIIRAQMKSKINYLVWARCIQVKLINFFFFFPQKIRARENFFFVLKWRTQNAGIILWLFVCIIWEEKGLRSGFMLLLKNTQYTWWYTFGDLKI